MSPLNITQPLDSIWYMVYNGYYKVMSNIPKSWDIYQPLNSPNHLSWPFPPAKESEVPSAITPMKLSCPGTHKGRGSPTRSLMHSTTPRHCTIPALRTNSSAEKQELWPASLQRKNPRSKASRLTISKNLRS